MRRIKASYVQAVLIVVAVVALLSWGVFAVLVTVPNDTGGIVDAAVTNIHVSSTDAGLKGNGTTIRPGTEAQFILVFKTTIPPGTGVNGYDTPNGEGNILSPVLWTMPETTLTSYQVNYAVFIYQFVTQPNAGFLMWFSGPQGNLTASYETSTVDRIQSNSAYRNLYFQTSLIEVPSIGNYTLNYFNTGTVNTTGIVGMGPSLVTFTHPYLYYGLTSMTIAGLLLVTTGLAFRSRRKLAPSSSPAK